MSLSMQSDELDTKFVMYTEKDDIYKTMMHVKLLQVNEVYDINASSIKYEKVLRDPEFDEIAKNNYETEFAVVLRPENISTTNPNTID